MAKALKSLWQKKNMYILFKPFLFFFFQGVHSEQVNE
jgi:hypothetical protein